MKKFKKMMTLLLTSLAGLYVLFILVFYLFQEKFIFQANKLPQNFQYSFEVPFEEITLIDDKEELSINGLYFQTLDTSKGIVLYFHGNAGDLSRWGMIATDFTNLGYDLLMIDYPGYGKSTGTPSEKAVYQSAATAYEWVAQKYKTDKIVVYGRSLGSAVASHLATTATIQQLILETPFYSMPEVIRTAYPWAFLPVKIRTQFPNYQHLLKTTCPITIFQGTKDRIVPYASAEKLKPFLKSSDEFITIEGGRHHNLREFIAYYDKLKRILK